MTWRVGLVGAGGFAGMHLAALESLADRAVVVAVADIRKDAADACAERLGCPSYGSYREMMRSEEIDVVDVLLPHAAHTQAVEDLAPLVRGIFLEKPLAASLEEGRRIVDSVRASGTTLMVAHQLLFHPIVRTAREAIAAGKIGRPVMARSLGIGWLHFTPWDFRLSKQATGGGMIADGLVHSIYMLIGLLGPVERVAGMAARAVRDEMEGEDQAAALLQFSSGVQGVVQGSYNARQPGWDEAFPEGWDQSTSIYGDRGTLRYSITPEPTLFIYDGSGDWQDITPQAEFLDSYREEFRAFFDALDVGKPAPVTAEDSLGFLRVIDALYQSLRTGCTTEVDDGPNGTG